MSEDREEPFGHFAPPQEEAAPTPIKLHWHGDADPYADRAWLVRDLLFEVGRGLLSGQWGAGKTFGALDLSASVMTGEPFAGKRVMRKGGVLFIAPEGAFEIPIRLRGVVAGKIEHLDAAKLADIDVQRLPICWIEECPPLLLPSAVDQLIATARVAADHMRKEFKVDLALVIIDTIAAGAGFTDENSAAEAQRLINAMGALSVATGSFVLGVDHFGKDMETGTRGSSGKEAGADSVLAMLAKREQSGSISDTRMAVRKVRGARAGYEIPYALEVIQVGENRDGDPITTCIVNWTTERAATSAPGSKDRWTTSLRVFKHALQDALETHGIRSWPHGASEPEQRAAPVDKVRAAFYATYPADADDDAKRNEAKKKAFQRAMKDATGRGLIASVELQGVDHLWIRPE